MNPSDEPRTLLTRGFWIALAFALACVVAAVIVVLVAEHRRLRPRAHEHSALPPAARYEAVRSMGKSKAGVDERPWNG